MLITIIDKHGNKEEIEQGGLEHSNIAFYESARGDIFRATKELYSALINGKKLFLYDPQRDFEESELKKARDILLEGDYFALFFTSGTTGKKRGVLKSLENIESETALLASMLKGYKRVFLCVPFFHIYGFLFGIALSLRLDIDIVIKEEVLPFDLLNLSQDTLCVLNPVLLRAFLRLKSDIDLSFLNVVSSTGSLSLDERKALKERFNLSPTEIFGSTETGGVAFRSGEGSDWELMEGVTLFEEDRLVVASRQCSRFYTEDGELLELRAPHYTGDIIKKSSPRSFELIGRDAEIIKISGKRYSAIELESIISLLKGIEDVLVEGRSTRGLRGESIIINIVAEKLPSKKEVEHLLRSKLGASFGSSIELRSVDEIKKGSNGKKIRKPIF